MSEQKKKPFGRGRGKKPSHNAPPVITRPGNSPGIVPPSSSPLKFSPPSSSPQSVLPASSSPSVTAPQTNSPSVAAPQTNSQLAAAPLSNLPAVNPPWARTVLIEEVRDIRRPLSKDGESEKEFQLTSSSFPPLPGTINTDEERKTEITPELAAPGTSCEDNISSDHSGKEEDTINMNSTVVEKMNLINASVSNTQSVLKRMGIVNGEIDLPIEKKDTVWSKQYGAKKLKISRVVQGKDDGKMYMATEDGRTFTCNEDGSYKRVYSFADIKADIEFVWQQRQELKEDTKQKLDKIKEQMEAAKALEEKRLEEAVLNSTLSPYATEFIPRAPDMNPDARDFVPISTNNTVCEENVINSTSTSQQSILVPNIDVTDTLALLTDLEETINFCYTRLNETPASYDELMGVLTPYFMKYMENPDLPDQIVRSLYAYAMGDPSFSYFSVRILVHLIQERAEHYGCTILREVLLKFTQQEFKDTQSVRLRDSNVSCSLTIHPFLVFLSELYIQLEVGGSRMHFIGKSLVSLLKELLSAAQIPIKERLKTITNMVKLTGLSLDEDNSSLLDELMANLQLMLEEQRSELDSPTVQHVLDIIALRNTNWGVGQPFVEAQTESNILPTGFEMDAALGSHNMAVFYGPDGQVLRYDEQVFLETNALSHMTLDDQEELSPHSMDGEMEEAFDEFLRTIPNRPQENN